MAAIERRSSDPGAPIGLRARLAIELMRFASYASRRLGRGSGSIIGGRIALGVCPRLLELLARGRQVVLVSGTNGKTTTTRLITEALGGPSHVATSLSGSNMPAGIVTALAMGDRRRPAVLEVDEGYLPLLLETLRPSVVVLLNLSRDQLDRVGEVRTTAQRWREALSGTGATVVASAEDPLVVYAASGAPQRRFVGGGDTWHEDAYHCPMCDQSIHFDSEGWACSCGFKRPVACWELTSLGLRTDSGEELALTLGLPGEFNRQNAAIAIAAASAFGVSPQKAVARVGTVHEVEGRYAISTYGDRPVRLLLAKNPAGWASLIDLSAKSHSSILVAVNARVADGHDPSWLFDVPFERLRGHEVVASGDRRFDLAVRLRHAGVEFRIGDPSPFVALGSMDAAETDVIANYTAFQDLRRALDREGAPPAVAPTRLFRATPSRRSPPDRGEQLQIVVVYPELLGTYGDTGNGIVLVNRAHWRGIDAKLVLAHSDRPLPRGGHVYVIGGGEDGPQVRAAAQLRDERFDQLVSEGAVVFAVCAGFQILGERFIGRDGKDEAGLGLIDAATIRTAHPRSVGELAGRCVVDGWQDRVGILTGFENHASHTKLGPRATPLMAVDRGVGNDGRGWDGAVQGRVIGSYLHGPALARNPALADLLLELATGHALESLDDEVESLLRASRLQALRLRQ